MVTHIAAASLPAVAAFSVESVPAQALRQRPDVASRERDLAAASASIGVSQADLYPSLQLGGSIGVSVTGGSSFTSWSFGPSLSIPLFDGGTRRAAVASARASHEVAYAQWRGAVRNAVTEVEKALLRLDDARQRVVQAGRAAQTLLDAADRGVQAPVRHAQLAATKTQDRVDDQQAADLLAGAADWLERLDDPC